MFLWYGLKVLSSRARPASLHPCVQAVFTLFHDDWEAKWDRGGGVQSVEWGGWYWKGTQTQYFRHCKYRVCMEFYLRIKTLWQDIRILICASLARETLEVSRDVILETHQHGVSIGGAVISNLQISKYPKILEKSLPAGSFRHPNSEEALRLFPATTGTSTKATVLYSTVTVESCLLELSLRILTYGPVDI
jgi:hypothetical protein